MAPLMMLKFNRGKALLLAFVVLFVFACPHSSTALQTAAHRWFRQKVSQKFRWLKKRKVEDNNLFLQVNSLETFMARLNFVGFSGSRSPADVFNIFTSVKQCFKSFSPPPGLAIDVSNDSQTVNNKYDETIKRLFQFTHPETLTKHPLLESQALAMKDPENSAVLLKYSYDPKHVLAYMIKAVYNHFRAPPCQEAARNLDGVKRFILRSNSRAAVMEPLLLFAIIQGNASSSNGVTSTEQQTPVYNPSIIIQLWDFLANNNEKQLMKFEKTLKEPLNGDLVARTLFGNLLTTPAVLQKITELNNKMGRDTGTLENVVKRIASNSMATANMVSIIQPNYPKVAKFLHMVSFFLFEGVFAVLGDYTMPGMPCGDKLSGNMVETITGRSLGAHYYVFKYINSSQDSILQSEIGGNVSHSEIATALTAVIKDKLVNEIINRLPRICVSSKLYKKCSSTEVSPALNDEDNLCKFIYENRLEFFNVNAKGVLAFRDYLRREYNQTRMSKIRSNVENSFLRARRMIATKTFGYMLAGAGLTVGCAVLGILGFLGGAACAIGALGCTLLGSFIAVAPFRASKFPIPPAVATFMMRDFDTNLNLISEYM